LPFFSDQSTAEQFAGAYTQKLGRVFRLEIAEVDGTAVLRVSADVDCLIFNDQSDDTKVAPAHQMRRMR
jgi:hypothetical protein